MSYGPIWYEWSKRPMVKSDAVYGEAPYTHTRHGVGAGTVTELYWCQPGLYRGAPGFTNTRTRAKLLEERTRAVEKCRAGLMDGHGNPTK